MKNPSALNLFCGGILFWLGLRTFGTRKNQSLHNAENIILLNIAEHREVFANFFNFFVFIHSILL